MIKRETHLLVALLEVVIVIILVAVAAAPTVFHAAPLAAVPAAICQLGLRRLLRRRRQIHANLLQRRRAPPPELPPNLRHGRRRHRRREPLHVRLRARETREGGKGKRGHMEKSREKRNDTGSEAAHVEQKNVGFGGARIQRTARASTSRTTRRGSRGTTHADVEGLRGRRLVKRTGGRVVSS